MAPPLNNNESLYPSSWKKKASLGEDHQSPDTLSAKGNYIRLPLSQYLGHILSSSMSLSLLYLFFPDKANLINLIANHYLHIYYTNNLLYSSSLVLSLL